MSCISPSSSWRQNLRIHYIVRDFLFARIWLARVQILSDADGRSFSSRVKNGDVHHSNSADAETEARRSCNGSEKRQNSHYKLLTEAQSRTFSSHLPCRSLHKTQTASTQTIFWSPWGDFVSHTTILLTDHMTYVVHHNWLCMLGHHCRARTGMWSKKSTHWSACLAPPFNKTCVADFLYVAGLQAEDSSWQWTWPHPLHVNTKPTHQSYSVCEIIWKGSYFRKQHVALVIYIYIYLLHFEVFHLRRFFAGETPFVDRATPNILGWTVMSRNAYKSVSQAKLVKLHLLWNTAVSRYL